MNFSQILEPYPRELVVEAAYYCVRRLKQSSLPPESQKEHFEDADESRPSQEATKLSNRIIASIEAHEGVPLKDMPRRASLSYVDVLLQEVARISANQMPPDEQRGRALLQQLRSK